MESIPSISTEYVHVPFAVSDPDTVSLVELALVLPGVIPAEEDWHTATWDNTNARILVGPQDGVVQLTAETTYVVWFRATSTPEHPARPTGYLLCSDLVPG